MIIKLVKTFPDACESLVDTFYLLKFKPFGIGTSVLELFDLPSYNWRLRATRQTLCENGFYITSNDEKPCGRSSKMLTISKFTSAQAQRSARWNRPPNSLVIKDKGIQEWEKKREGDWGVRRGWRRRRSVAISFQTVLWKCAEATHALGHCVHWLVKATCIVSTVRALFITVHGRLCFYASDSMTLTFISVCVCVCVRSHALVHVQKQWVGSFSFWLHSDDSVHSAAQTLS